MDRVGELAALATALCWAVSVLCFEDASKRVGSTVVNLLRLPLALAMLAAWSWALRGIPLPTDATAHNWMWLGASGIVGFVLGDLFLFRAFVEIGGRLCSLIMATTPIWAVLFGFLLLGETLLPIHWVGMMVTMAGVGLALWEKPVTPRPGRKGLGIGLALLGAIGQAGGLILSKYGMGTYNAFAATEIRVIFGIVGFAAIFSITGQWRRIAAGLRDKRALKFTTLGAIAGPFLGVSMSLIAVQNTRAGVAAAIMSTTPIVIIPLVILIHRERVRPAGIIGALLAVSGVMLLFSGHP